MSTTWVPIVLKEGEDPVEIQTEENGTLLLSSISAQFPGATGLKFRNPQTNGMRGVRISEGVLFSPFAEEGGEKEGWSRATEFICVIQQPEHQTETGGTKRSAGAEEGSNAGKRSKTESDDDPTVDLIVLGVNYATTEDGMRKYFETFGEVVLCDLKVGASGKSKGFGFIRFAHMAAQDKVLLTRHFIDMRWCDVRIPDSSSTDKTNTRADSKVFVARVTDALTDDDLRQHFEQFGEITDLYCPRPSRGFAFVQFVEARVAKSLLEKDHVIKGVSVHIGAAKPKGPAASRNDFGAPSRSK